ncbi:MAG: hypothetical protein PHF05_05195 [Candidatus Izemoplasmatales bacterium]|nr:hypothetical protein [Candidatus Izemoplasmatales bacterium]
MKLLMLKRFDDRVVYVNINEIVCVKDNIDRTTIVLTNQEIVTTFEKIEDVINQIKLALTSEGSIF